MPVKLSSYLWLRNNYLVPFTRGERDTGRYMKPEERAELKKIIDGIDELHGISYSEQRNQPLVGPNVVLSGYTEIIERSSDPKRSGELFQRVHEILKDHLVDINVYRNLGGAFRELGIEPPEEIKIAIDYATRQFDMPRWSGKRRDRMGAKYVIEDAQRQASKERL